MMADKSTWNARRVRLRGFSMLETLVTLFIISVWLLGSAGVQTMAMKLNKTSQFRNQAVQLASEIGERMEANKAGAVTNAYVYDGSAVTLTTNCVTSICSPTQLAAFDKYEIRSRATAALPAPVSGTNPVVITSGGAANPITYTITISWLDRRTDQTYSTTGTDEAFTFIASKTIYQ